MMGEELAMQDRAPHRTEERGDALEVVPRKANRKAYKAAYYLANRDEIIKRSAARYAAHPEECKAYHAAWYEANREREKERKAARRAANPAKERARDNARRAANPEKFRAQAKALRAANPEKFRMQKAARRAANREQINKRQNKRRAANPGECRARDAAWRLTHREQINKRQNKRRAAHPEEYKASFAAWRKTPGGKECMSFHGRKHEALKRQIKTIAPDLALTRQEWEKIKRLAKGKCYWHRSPNCPNRNGKRMTRPTQDHVIPLSKGGLHVAENIVAACRSCNSKKKAKILTLL